jgi:hypothetical protein
MKFIVVASKDRPTVLRFKGDDHNDAIFFRVWRMIRPNRKGYGAIIRIVTLSRTHIWFVLEMKMASKVQTRCANSKLPWFNANRNRWRWKIALSSCSFFH